MSDVTTFDTSEPSEKVGLFKRLVNAVPLPVWFIVPVEAILLFLLITPSIMSIWLSLVSWQPTFGIGILSGKFIWFKNYIDLFTEARFLWAFARTFIITGVCVSVQFLIGLGLAMLVYRPVPGRKFFTLVLILPMMFPPLVVGNNFYMLFFAEGPINALISYVIGSPFRLDWLSHRTWAIFPIMIAEIWQWYPLMFLIMIAGLRGMPPNQLRAAEVLGGTPWQIFWRIKIPQLVPIILIAFVIRAMEVLKLFDLVYIMTKGGPGSETETISMYMFKIGLKDFRTSYISAGAWIVLIALVILFVRLLRPILYRVEEFGEKIEEAK
ncbi:MAG: ABC transporter permease subunit [Proteobacteria bacterium]|nr:ABC transporter permease subunit [Pseudomonadota bacterium]